MTPKHRQVQSTKCRMQSAECRVNNRAPDSSLCTLHSALCTSSRSGFTLTEMLVVIGIIILFVTLAIPAISSITGTRSISAAENQISAVLARAREEAIGIQDYRGVLFYLDPREDRVVAILVRAADNQLTNSNLISLDAVANRDYLMLPQGIRLQTICDDSLNRYFGFNPMNPASTEGVLYGGVILFDGQGRLVSKPYAFSFLANGTPTGLAAALKAPSNASLFLPTNGNSFFRSQMGLVLFDSAAFKAQGFTDGDLGTGFDQSVTASGPNGETSEEAWLDANSTPLLINRFNGTLIRGE
jgi:prepilin-type N-terminal cleavage/methylation domain-containing protein